SISQRSAGQSGVNKKALEAYEIVTPPIEIQQQTIEKIKYAAPRVNEISYKMNQKLNDLKALKASLLDTAFKGEL
ncbi:restriction endonuclease subunit S, partial [bacterium]|nr:restriction endonuclease subunit S [bacterium]